MRLVWLPDVRAVALSDLRCSRLNYVAAWLFVFPLLAGGAVAAEAGGDAFVKAVEIAERATVAVLRYGAIQQRGDEFQGTFEPPDLTELLPNEFASGVIIRAAGTNEPLVLTSYHAVMSRVGRQTIGELSPIVIRFWNRRGCSAQVRAADPRSDLCVLEFAPGAINLRPEEIPAVVLGDAGAIRKGQMVLTLGNPYAMARDGSASAGLAMVANSFRQPIPDPVLPPNDFQRKPTIHHLGTLWQLDGRINIGSSGGALVNTDGQLVGLTTSQAAIEGYEKAGGFAIPIDRHVRRIIDGLAKGFEVEYGFLGIEMEDVQYDLPRKLDGLNRPLTAVMAKRVMRFSPADLAGIQDGDLIVSVNGQNTDSRDDLMRMVGLEGPGNLVKLSVLREGQTEPQIVVAQLGKWPVRDDEGIVATQTRYPIWRGLTVDYTTARQKYFTRDTDFQAAVIVLAVKEGSVAQKQGLQAGDLIDAVNGRSVSSPEEFWQLVSATKGTVRLRLPGDRFTGGAKEVKLEE
jgi:serine protease Do